MGLRVVLALALVMWCLPGAGREVRAGVLAGDGHQGVLDSDRPGIFILGEGGFDVVRGQLDGIRGQIPARSCSLWGRPHDRQHYDHLFAAGDPEELRAGDVMVLMISVDRLEQVPEEYRFLLPRSLEELAAQVARGGPVAEVGRHEDLHVVTYAAASVEGLTRLAQQKPFFALLTGAPAPRPVGPRRAEYSIRIRPGELRSVHVTLRLTGFSGRVELSMAHAGHLPLGYATYIVDVSARDSDGRQRELRQAPPGWRFEADPVETEVRYQLLVAHDAVLWPGGGPDEAPYVLDDNLFLTGRALFLSAAADEYRVRFEVPDSTQVSTPWPPAEHPLSFTPGSETDLRESFLLLGRHTPRLARAGDVEVLVAVGGALEPDGDRLVDSVQQLLEFNRALFAGAPSSRKLLVANRSPRVRGLHGGVFGQSISMLVSEPLSIASQDRWLPFVAHEVFHLWDGTGGITFRERSAWFTEGVTEYYAFLGALRTGQISRAVFLERIEEALHDYLGAAGTTSLQEADRRGKIRPLVYDGGCLAGLCLDLTLRTGPGMSSLDEVMASLFRRCQRTGPLGVEEVAQVGTELGQVDLEPFFAAHIHGTELLPVQEALAPVGITVRQRRDAVALERGYLVHELLRIQSLSPSESGLVIHRSADAGYQDGDVLLRVEGRDARDLSALAVAAREWLELPEISVTVRRGGTEITLSQPPCATPPRVRSEVEVEVGEDPAATDEQRALRDAWLRGER